MVGDCCGAEQNKKISGKNAASSLTPIGAAILIPLKGEVLLIKKTANFGMGTANVPRFAYRRREYAPLCL